MRARLSVDVRDNPESHFLQTAPGVYGLKEHAFPLTFRWDPGEDAVYWWGKRSL